MIKFLIHFLFKFVLYVLVFLFLSWLLLGIGPQEALRRSEDNLGNLWGRLTGTANVVAQTAGDMKNAAGYQLQQAADRIDGKDPYEDFNKRLSEQVQKDTQ